MFFPAPQGRKRVLAGRLQLHGGNRTWRFDPPITEPIPVVTEHLGRVHGAVRAIAAGQVGSRAIAVAAPADALRMRWVERKFLGHGQALGLPCGIPEGYACGEPAP